MPRKHMTNKSNNKLNEIPMEALQLTPWYATGCLTADERKYFQKQLKKYPALQEYLEEEQEIIRHVHQDKTVLELSSLEPTEIRLKKMLSRLDGTRTIKNTVPAHNQGSLTPAQTVRNPINWFKNIFTGSENRQLHFASFASIAIFAALMVAFIAPLIKDKSKTVFHPATIQTKETTQRSPETTLLLGLNGNTQDIWLVNFLKKNHAKLSKIQGKDGLYRITFDKKLTKNQTAALINELNKHKKLVWFAGEAY
jgi:hypothetical protein